MKNQTMLLSYDDVQKYVSMEKVVEIVEDVFLQHGLDKVAMPAKVSLDMTRFLGYDTHMNAMPAYIDKLNIAGLKWAGGFDANPPRGLPYIMAMLLLIEPLSGIPLAVMEASWITAVRTGAAAAVAAKYLAPKGSKVAAIFGAGVQGRTCLSALDIAMDLEEVRITDVSEEVLARFIDQMKGKVKAGIRGTVSGREAVADADVIVTATTADEPIVREAWVGPETVLVSMGTYPELEESIVLGASKLVVDSWAQTKHRGEFARLYERGDLDDSSIYAELGEIVAGKVPGRETGDGRIVACPIGMGSLDVAVAHAVYKKAKASGLHQEFSFIETP